MFDAARVRHAGSRHDDGATADRVDRLALLDRLDDAEPGILEELVGTELDVLEHAGVLGVDAGDFAGERAIKEDELRIDGALADQHPDIVQHLLAALDGEGRNDEVTAAAERLVDLRLEHVAALGERAVLPVAAAVSGLRENVVEP